MSTNLPPIDQAPRQEVDWQDRFGAAWTQETIQTDAWSYKARTRRDILQEMESALSPEQRETFDNRPKRPRSARYDADFEKALLDVINQPRPSGDPLAADIPTTAEALSQETDNRLIAEWDEADTLLRQSGYGVAGFSGTMARAITDEFSLALMPFGLGGSAARVIAGEALLGAVGEAMIMPRENRMAETLEIEPLPEWQRVAMGAAAGGVLAGALTGAQRGARYLKSSRSAQAELRPDGVDSAAHEAEIQSSAEILNDTRDPRAVDDVPALRMNQFDFGRGGNADPASNAVGYVYGQLIARGMTPEVAAGFVGNFMQESGAGLNRRAIGDNGNAYGIAQWNGPRRRQLEAFARARGKTWDDLETQIDFLFHELQGSEAGAMARIRQAKSAEDAAMLISRFFERPGIPHNESRVRYAATIMEQVAEGKVPRWTGRSVPVDGTMTLPTARGYTDAGQVSYGSSQKIDVAYEVVDAATLTRASGDLQPRDRSRSASDEQIGEIAAGLDPARLMPAPEADRGAPIVGPDNVIESGNGRVMAIQRAAQEAPDRSRAYRQAIEEAGFTIPEDVETPVLIGRRTSALDAAGRQDFVRSANNATVARMSSTERAQADAAALPQTVVRDYVPGQPLTAGANRDFVRGALASMPQAERAALVDASGVLNADGAARLQNALLARAFDAPDILARATETGAGEMRAFVDALNDAAPAWAALRADIEAGAVRAEFDIGGHVLDAMRLIANARAVAAQQGGSTASIIDEMLDAIDLIEGPVAPLTAALVRKFRDGDRALDKNKIAEFLTRYAGEARKVGSTDAGLLGDDPGPLDVLRAIDPLAFGELTELGQARGRVATSDPVAIAEADPGYVEGATSAASLEADAAGIDALRDAIENPDRVPADLRSELGDFEFTDETGVTWKASEMLDDLDADADLMAALDACPVGRAA